MGSEQFRPAKMMQGRIIIYPKDIEMITGKKNRTARRLLQQVRKAKGKLKHHLITIAEFCQYMGIDEQAVRQMIRD